ncbi:MAG: 30S ribosomal protein S6e [Nanoarchaeota archaeon]|nr:30S ribosomal protein S6e [Nanoarchaeota archaeon]
MAELKIVINEPKTGKSYQKALAANPLAGMKIKQKVSGDMVEMPGYEFEITGGSDDSGFPMRQDIDGPLKKKALLTGGTGLKTGTRLHKRNGLRKRKTVAGNTITDKTAQVNLKVLKAGSDSLDKLFGKEEAPKEEKEKAPKEEKKEEPKKEEPKDNVPKEDTDKKEVN